MKYKQTWLHRKGSSNFGAHALGRNIDIACINAGVGVGGLFAETDLDAELNMVYLNCAGTATGEIRGSRYAPRNAGKILLTSSIDGEMVAPREAVYAATKTFGLSFAHSLRYELRDTGVSVTALQPGLTNTDFFHRTGMDDTEVGSEGKTESQPNDVARQRIEALLAGPVRTTSTRHRQKRKWKACWRTSLPAV